MDLRKLKTLIDLVQNRASPNWKSPRAKSKVRIAKSVGAAGHHQMIMMQRTRHAAVAGAAPPPRLPPRRRAAAVAPRHRPRRQVADGRHLLPFGRARRRRRSSRSAATVKEGDTLCIIEAMKLMNEIEADASGTIKQDPGRERPAGRVRPAAVRDRLTSARRAWPASAPAAAASRPTNAEPMFEKILIANRGEIALRIQRACRELGIKTVVVHSEADTEAKYVKLADESVCIGPAAVRAELPEHPGHHQRRRSDRRRGDPPRLRLPVRKRRFRRARREIRLRLHRPAGRNDPPDGRQGLGQGRHDKAGVPCVPGSEGALPDDPKEIIKIARKVGYPVIIKAAGGGGGRGMRVVHTEAALINAVTHDHDRSRQRLRQSGGLHGEVPGESAPRRNPDPGRQLQERGLARRARLLDAAPPPEGDRGSAGAGHPAQLIDKIGDRCAEACRKIGYRGAGTFEFLYENGEFYFIEMNTRVQVEHPVTELVTGIDIVQAQIRVAPARSCGSGSATSSSRATRSSAASTPKTRSSSRRRRARSPTGIRPAAPASGSIRTSIPATTCRRITTR